MELRIKISPQMATEKSPLGSVEDRLLRVPKELRDRLDLSIGQYLTFQSHDGQIHLQVARCYVEDAREDPDSVYVTTDTHDKLVIKTVANIQPAADILIGCDPEFYLINHINKYPITASIFFASHGEIGSDCGLAELRPRPSFQSEQVAENIGALLKKSHDYLVARERRVLKDGSIDMIARSFYMGKAAGFHIHFGLPAFMLRDGDRTRVLLAQIVSVLDYYVGVPSIIPEDVEDNLRRSGEGQYGRPSAHRFDAMTLEYRVPGGHLLRHPVLTKGLLAMSILTVRDMLSRMKAYTENFTRRFDIDSYDKLNALYPNIPSQAMVYSAIASPHIDLAIGLGHNIYKDMEKMVGFERNKKDILEYFSYVVRMMNKKEKYDELIAPNWRLAQ